MQNNSYNELYLKIYQLLQKDSYISKKEYQEIIDQYTILFDTIQKLPNTNIKENLITISNNIDNWIINHNKKFVEKKLIEYENYFDHIFDAVDPSIKLDIEQRKAILTDEDYSLVIAGAGSGKTTTMTAKVKYLIDKCHIKSDEIVVLSFTNKAVEELDSRINQDFNLKVIVETFHKLGLDILNSRLTKKVKAIEEKDKKEIINKYIKETIFKDKKELFHIKDLFHNDIFFDSSCANYLNFEDYWNHFIKITYEKEKDHLKEYNTSQMESRLDHNQSINGEFLRSKPETIIANFLFTNNIEYSYEEKYEESENRINYNPDFTVYGPKGKKIYIEFYGLTKYMQYGRYSKEEILEYNYLIQKKKILHQKYQTELIEVYPDDNFSSTNYLTKLKNDLEEKGIFCFPKSDQEIFQRIRETKKNSQIYKFVDLVLKFIAKFKSNSYTEKDFITLQNKTKNNVVKEQLNIMYKFYKYYNKQIHSNYLIDFEDMVNYAYRYMENQPLKEEYTKYKYIIVDEYQDISNQRFNLLQKISEVFNAKIIGVGDDWQAIFSFSGSDIKLFTNFCEFMGYGEILKITNTYRNSQELIDIAGDFVLKNSDQFNKKLNSNKHLKNPIEIIYYDKTENISCLLEQILEYIYHTNPQHTVLLLGRYNNDKKIFLENSHFKEGIISQNEIIYTKHRDMNIKFLTVHSAKGLGYDQVIILNAKDAKYGFPTKIKEEEILAILNNDTEENIEFAEERRLFYVAITRTKNKVYILAPNKNSSIFIKEIKNYDNVIEKFNKMDNNTEDIELEII